MVILTSGEHIDIQNSCRLNKTLLWQLLLFVPLTSVFCTLDVPMEFDTLQEQFPMTSIKLASMVSVLLQVEVALSTRVCVNEYIVSLAGSVTPSLAQVTVVGGEPVEVQVRAVKEEDVFCSNTVTRGTAERREMYGHRSHQTCTLTSPKYAHGK